ncbi:MAG: response regulator, partial [Sulfurimonas sp.]|nr:response regulator [Sulfurimonas sp.]
MIFCTDNDFIQKKLETGSILIVEDSSFFNNALRKGLTFLGYDVTSAYKLKEALSYIEKRSFDLIILDLHLPDGEGEDLFKQLNTKQKQEIVIYTSDPDQEPHDEWLHNGTNGGGKIRGYLSKNDPFPYIIQEIDKTIKAIYENTQYNILVVDDSSVICRQMTSLLQSRNYNIIVANDGGSVLSAIKNTMFDLIILDLDFSDMYGEDVLKHLKKNTATAKIPVFIITEDYDVSTIEKLIKQGANEFFLKPFIREELLLKIDFWIDSKRKARESECERQLLQEYKDTVDRSSIVSKTDKRGVISFVNEKFCEISGYLPSELI